MTDATHLLFTYGTLQRADIQRQLFGRLLQGQPDVLEGYALEQIDLIDEACAITGLTRYPILRYEGPQAQPIAGMVYTLSTHELLRADTYEGPAYRRVYLPLQSGRKAWVYVDAQDAAA